MLKGMGSLCRLARLNWGFLTAPLVVITSATPYLGPGESSILEMSLSTFLPKLCEGAAFLVGAMLGAYLPDPGPRSSAAILGRMGPAPSAIFSDDMW